MTGWNTTSANDLRKSGEKSMFILPNNYLYISHLDDDFKYWLLPDSPDSIQDSMASSFGSTNALGRTAPVYTYQHSGPRQVQVTLKLHRDIMNDTNLNVSNSELQPGEDYVENLTRAIQSIALPKYNLDNKAVEPPLVAVRFGNQVFIKGIVNDAVGVTYEKPILVGDKYAIVTLSFTVTEVDPYDASTVFENGSFRGVVKSLRGGLGFDDGEI